MKNIILSFCLFIMALLFLGVNNSNATEYLISNSSQYNDFVDYKYLNDTTYTKFLYQRLTATDSRFFYPRIQNQAGIYDSTTGDPGGNYPYTGGPEYPSKKVYIKLENGNILTLFGRGTKSSNYDGQVRLAYYDYTDNSFTYKDLPTIHNAYPTKKNIGIAFIGSELFIRSDTGLFCKLDLDNIDKTDLCATYNETIFNHYIQINNGIHIVQPIYNVNTNNTIFFMLNDDKTILKSYESSLDYGGQIEITDVFSITTGIINNFLVISDNDNKSSISIFYNNNTFKSIILNNGQYTEHDGKYITKCNFTTGICYWLEQTDLANIDFTINDFSINQVNDLNNNDTLTSQTTINQPFYTVNNNGNTDIYYFREGGFYVNTTTNPFDSDSSQIIGGTSSGTIDNSGNTIPYDETIFNCDQNGDGECGILNGEVFIAIGNFFHYIFNGLMDFFGNIKELIIKLGSIFTTEEKTFTLGILNNTYANGEITSVIDSVNEESYDNTLLGKIDNFFKAFVSFFLVVMSIVWIIVFKNKKND